jgi:mono/diheme cytochrome c family protein
MNGQRHLRQKFFFALILFSMGVMFLLALACDAPERLRTNAELGLNEQQARGREIYDLRCGGCHEPYRKKDLNGPSMVGVFKHPYLPSGMAAREDRVSDIILTEQQLRDLLAYMHTL